MKITFIGSSHGVPEPHRKCSCIMIEVGEQVYFIDMGTSAIDALRTRGISIDAVKGIFITHMHGDHTNGLIQFVDLITWFFRTPDPVICLPNMAAARVIDDWLKVTLNGGEKKINYRETKPGVVFDDGVLKVTAFATMHCEKSYAYLVEAEGKAVLFTGDLKNPGIDFPAVTAGMTTAADVVTVDVGMPLDLLVCESAHFSAMNYLPILEKSNIQKVCVTHYSNRHFASVLQLQQELTDRGMPMVIATDDLELNV